MISVIVPVYNTGQYLRRCIDSLIAQTYSDLEIIIIDDGSKAKTAKICDDMVLMDSRIKVCHIPNGGVSNARNFGMRVSKGDYIGFVDSDDWIAPNMFESLLLTMEVNQTEIAMCDAKTVWKNGKTEEDTISFLKGNTVLKKTSISPSVLLELAGSCCRLLYRKDLLLSKNICFPTSLRFSEDRIFNINAIGAAKSISYLKTPLYYRFVRMGSCSYSYRHDTPQMVLEYNRLAKVLCQKYWAEAHFQLQNLRNANEIGTYVLESFNHLSPKEWLKNIDSLSKDNDIHSILIHSKSILCKSIVQRRFLFLCLFSLLSNIKNFIKGISHIFK